jgi:predicted PurR-regulated permease PerM
VTLFAFGIFLIMGLHALHSARVVLLPLATALLLRFALRTPLRLLTRVMPPPIAGSLLVLGLGAAMAGAIYGLSEPAAQWLHDAPQALQRAKYQLNSLRGGVENVREATEQVEELGNIGAESDALEVKVINDGTDLVSLIVNGTRRVIAGAVLTLLILFFLLGWGATLFRNLVRALPGFHNRRRMLSMAMEMQKSVGAYFSIVTLINSGLGLLVGVAMFLLEMPNPVLWGVVAAVLNYMPYVGPLVTSTILLLVGVVTFSDLGQALIPPAVFLLLTSVEGQIVTPMALGRRLLINPLVIFVATLWWFALWGPVGALFTVPFLICLQVALKSFDGTRGLGRALGK